MLGRALKCSSEAHQTCNSAYSLLAMCLERQSLQANWYGPFLNLWGLGFL